MYDEALYMCPETGTMFSLMSYIEGFHDILNCPEDLRPHIGMKSKEWFDETLDRLGYVYIGQVVGLFDEYWEKKT